MLGAGLEGDSAPLEIVYPFDDAFPILAGLNNGEVKEQIY